MNRTQYLIDGYLDDTLNPVEREELDVLLDSNSHARALYDEAAAFKRGLASTHDATVGGNSPSTLSSPASASPRSPDVDRSDHTFEHPKMPLWMRAGAILIVIVLLGSLALLPFVRIEQPLLKVSRGTLLQGATRVEYVEEPADLVVPPDLETNLVVRGGMRLSLTGPAQFRADKRWPAAVVTLIDGALEGERNEHDRESFLTLGPWLLEPFGETQFFLETRPNGPSTVSWRFSRLPSLPADARFRGGVHRGTVRVLATAAGGELPAVDATGIDGFEQALRDLGQAVIPENCEFALTGTGLVIRRRE